MSDRSFEGVTAHALANVYFDGKVVSHTILLESGSKVTLGLIYPGTYHFGTGAPERMDITSGSCQVKLEGETAFRQYPAGTYFDVPGNSSFDITVESGIAQYICSFG
jgi:uncharacterized protein YaiE (UPF0345 family)